MKGQSRSSGTSSLLHWADKAAQICVKHSRGPAAESVHQSDVKALFTKKCRQTVLPAHHLPLELFWRILNPTKAERDERCGGRLVLCLFCLESSQPQDVCCALWLSSWRMGGAAVALASFTVQRRPKPGLHRRHAT